MVGVLKVALYLQQKTSISILYHEQQKQLYWYLKPKKIQSLIQSKILLLIKAFDSEKKKSTNI